MGSRKTFDGADKIYAAADEWVKRALRSDDSLFTPGVPIWSHELLGELHSRFLNNPDLGAGSFYDKLEVQLADSPAEVYQLMAEVLYVHFLIVWQDAMKRDTKANGINRVLGWSGSEDVKMPDDLLAAQAPGIAHPGIAFGTYRPYQVGFLIEFAEQWKEQAEAERNRLLDDPWAFKEFANGISFSSALLINNQNTPRIQREALLHLVFPDTFEGTVSINQKNGIAQADTFARYITEQTDDVDRAIQQIRQGLERELGRDFDFYDDDISIIWDPQKRNWDTFVRLAQEVYDDANRFAEWEIRPKIGIGEKLASAREAVLNGSDDWEALVRQGIDSAGGYNLFSNWRSADDLRKWLDNSPGDVLRVLRAIWADDDSLLANRIRAFSGLFPSTVISGRGVRATAISVFLMGLNVNEYPPYRTGAFNKAYDFTGYGRTDGNADEAARYEHALGFLDQFIEEASSRGLELRHRLDAQSLTWLLTYGQNAPLNTIGEQAINEPPIEPEDEPGQEEPDLQILAQRLTLPVEFP